MTIPILETKRLKLVEIKKEHAKRIYEILSLEEVTRQYGMDSLKNLEDAYELVDLFNSNFVEKRGMRWGIVIKESDLFIGTIGLNALQTRHKRAEIGYEIHPDYWRKGFASEAVKEVLRYGFEELDLYRIGAVTFLNNEASSNLLLKLGFQKEGLLRGYIHQGNASHDTFVFSMIKPDWLKMQQI
jgi:ribosomal-protein-alanine N-acetyltransferase